MPKGPIVIAQRDGFRLRLAAEEDAAAYYEQNYCPLDRETARLTGSKSPFTREEVLAFFRAAVRGQDQYLFLILSPGGKIIGESVINELDPELRCANFRIALFHPAEQGRGIGSWAIEATCDFALSQLGLHRLSLDVYSFNPRAERAYRKAGFRREGVLRDAVRDGGRYADDILMAMLEDEWRARKAAHGLPGPEIGKQSGKFRKKGKNLLTFPDTADILGEPL